jgi:hypothetical protein
VIISIGESRPKKWKIGAQAIMLFEKVNFSHTFVSWVDEFGFRWVAEARGDGVQIISNYEFKRYNKVINIYQYNCSYDNYRKALEYVWRNSSDYYNFWQIYGLFEMRVLNGIFTKRDRRNYFINRFADGDYSQICTEFSIKTSLLAKTGDLKYIDTKPEQMGLIETRYYNINNCDLMFSQETLDKINGET